jgi:Domain of unknown function (DUF4190)
MSASSDDGATGQEVSERKNTVLIVGSVWLGVTLFLVLAVPTPWMQASASLLLLVGLILVIVGVVIRVQSGKPRHVVAQPAQPIAHTPDGKPIYQVVGYTPDGQAITADKAVGLQQFNPKTNSFAVVALIMGFVFPLLAIPFGHIARGQIQQTGEQGAGLALAGLILGYIGLSALIILFVVMAASG